MTAAGVTAEKLLNQPLALSQVGVNVTALLTGLGIAGFIVGFALQDTLGNFASGAMILLYRPFDMGDVIEAGGVMLLDRAEAIAAADAAGLFLWVRPKGG